MCIRFEASRVDNSLWPPPRGLEQPRDPSWHWSAHDQRAPNSSGNCECPGLTEWQDAWPSIADGNEQAAPFRGTMHAFDLRRPLGVSWQGRLRAARRR